VFTDVRAPSTPGVFLPVATFGHVRQLDAVAEPHCDVDALSGHLHATW